MVHNQNIIRREKLQVYIYFYITGLEYTNGTTDIGGFGAKVKNLLLLVDLSDIASYESSVKKSVHTVLAYSYHRET